jgi:hypothetical protein
MNWPLFLMELLKLIVPALIVFLTAYFVLNSYLENDYQKKLLEMRVQNQNSVTPLRLQAYERLTLFVERISLQTIIMRTHQTGMTARDLHTAMLQDIRAEFDHNVSQQIFVSPQTWTMIKAVKEETINIINYASSNLPPQATSLDLSKAIFEALAANDKNPHQVALQMIRTEVQQYF